MKTFEPDEATRLRVARMREEAGRIEALVRTDPRVSAAGVSAWLREVAERDAREVAATARRLAADATILACAVEKALGIGRQT
jgi:hypothetical protein